MSIFELKILEKNETSVRFYLLQDGKALTFEEVFQLWRTDFIFIEFYRNLLLYFGFRAFFWEHPPVKNVYMSEIYECTVIQSTELEKIPNDPNSFHEYIHSDLPVRNFRNLGRDATLIVPSARHPHGFYTHFGVFLLMAHINSVNHLFHRIGDLMALVSICKDPIWLNTSGLGVGWLHIRMDSTPKYYQTEVYKYSNYFSKNY